jgi:hypothetical protein
MRLVTLHDILASGGNVATAGAAVVFTLNVPAGIPARYTGPGTNVDIIPATASGQTAALGPVAAPTAANLAGGGSIDAGTYLYAYSFVAGGFETALSPASGSVVSAGGDRATLTAIAVGTTVLQQGVYAAVTARILYRSNNAGATWQQLATINDTTTTTYTDSASQASIASNPAPYVAGEYRIGVCANGDITPATTWQVSEAGIVTQLISFNYTGSVVEVSTLYASSPTPGVSGTDMYEYDLGGGGQPSAGLTATVTPSQDLVDTASGVRFLSKYPRRAAFDANNRVYFAGLPKGSGSNPLNTPWIYAAPGGAVEWFTVPDTGPASIYDHRTTPALPGLQSLDSTNIAHSTDVPALIDDPVQSPVSVDDDLQNLASRIPGARRSITTSAAINAVTDDNLFASAAGGAIAPSLPPANTRTRKLYIIKTDATANTITITVHAGDLINGVGTLVLTSQYQWGVLESDGGTNWYAQTGVSGAGVSTIIGTVHEVIASGASGNVTLSTPQDIDTVSSPTFASLTLGGLTGSTSAGRWVGTTPSGPPTTGTHVVGDWAQDQTGRRYTCTGSGTPGTWTQEPGTGGGGAASFTFAHPAKTANYILLPTDSGIEVDATSNNVTITLETAVGSTARHAIKRIDACTSGFSVAVITSGGQTIGSPGVSTFPLLVQDQTLEVESNNTNWDIITGYLPNPLTTKGDLPVAGAAAALTRLGVSGTNSRVLTEDSTAAVGMSWQKNPIYGPLVDSTGLLIRTSGGTPILVQR